jgi:hypothetical protein
LAQKPHPTVSFAARSDLIEASEKGRNLCNQRAKSGFSELSCFFVDKLEIIDILSKKLFLRSLEKH